MVSVILAERMPSRSNSASTPIAPAMPPTSVSPLTSPLLVQESTLPSMSSSVSRSEMSSITRICMLPERAFVNMVRMLL